ncbi:MAG TPA: beta-ketoacyl reductase, partial [Solirubrobacterales bacterium]|nr:beta-ketoacyl reductase [Solirubrobacterales bacterium]
TRESDVELVFFSSIAATFGSPGQANYAAANAFLDALATRRASEGLGGLALGWGGWQKKGELTAELSDADQARLARAGILPFTDAEGLELFERARSSDRTSLHPVRLDLGALRAAARAGTLPATLRGLVRTSQRRSSSFPARLAGVSEEERAALVLELVRAEAAMVLGHDAASAVGPAQAFSDLGLDSLGGVEVRNRLAAATGLALPATLVFDHPSAAAVAEYLESRLGAGTRAGRDPVEEAIDHLQALLETAAPGERERFEPRLRSLVSERSGDESEADAVERIRSASAEEILEIVNDEMGVR